RLVGNGQQRAGDGDGGHGAYSCLSMSLSAPLGKLRPKSKGAGTVSANSENRDREAPGKEYVTVRPPGRRRNGLVLCLLLTPLFAGLLNGGTIVTEAPTMLKACVILVGLVFGAVLAFYFFVQGHSEGASGKFGMIAMPIMCAVLFSYYLRLGEEIIGFWNVVPNEAIVMAKVTGASSGKSGPTAYVTPYKGAREISIRVSRQVYSRLEPIRLPGRDCLIVTIQSGRFGIQRTFVPTPLDTRWGLERLRACKVKNDYTQPRPLTPSS
ncbi:MAG: hypothetical protein V4579_03520, partial [Pseudomonadota bacterium]